MTEKATPQQPGPESPASSEEKRARGEQRLRSRRAVIRRIRVRIALGSVCLFLLCWLAIFGVLVEGKDPALSAKAHHNEAHVSAAVKSTVSHSPKSSSSAKSKAASAEAASTETNTAEAAASNTASSETASSGESEAATEDTESASRSSESSATPMTTSQS
jgi:cytoskeletal protein RodZ